MKKLIELDAALEGLENLNAISFYEANEHSKEAYMETKGMLKTLPTVDAVPVKHGRWIYHPDWQADGECGYECSECGMGSDVDYPYCMLCGARMEREGR